MVGTCNAQIQRTASSLEQRAKPLSCRNQEAKPLSCRNQERSRSSLLGSRPWLARLGRLTLRQLLSQRVRVVVTTCAHLLCQALKDHQRKTNRWRKNQSRGTKATLHQIASCWVPLLSGVCSASRCFWSICACSGAALTRLSRFAVSCPCVAELKFKLAKLEVR